MRRLALLGLVLLAALSWRLLGAPHPSLPTLERDQAVPFRTATFASGCFWGPDARFGALPGVLRTRVGYCGGTTPSPTYEHIGDHTESVQVDFDPARVSYAQLLATLAASPNLRHKASKRQYRNLVFYHDESQRQEARKALEGQGLEVALEPYAGFTRAEDSHQKYHLQMTGLMDDYRRSFPSFRSFVDSTAAARANAYASGYGTPEQLAGDLPRLGLSPSHVDELRRLYAAPGLHCN